MSAGRRLEGVHQGQSHFEVYGGSERLHHTKCWRAEQAWKKFERHPTSRSVRYRSWRRHHGEPPTSPDGRSQKAKQKRLISVISLFSLVLERRAAGEKAPSSAHREKAKSAFFLANNGVPLRPVCAAGHPRQRRNFYRRQGAFTHGNGISTCHCTRVLPLYLQLAAAVLSPLPYHQCGHDERQRCPVEQPTSRRASPSSP